MDTNYKTVPVVFKVDRLGAKDYQPIMISGHNTLVQLDVPKEYVINTHDLDEVLKVNHKITTENFHPILTLDGLTWCYNTLKEAFDPKIEPNELEDDEDFDLNF